MCRDDSAAVSDFSRPPVSSPVLRTSPPVDLGHNSDSYGSSDEISSSGAFWAKVDVLVSDPEVGEQVGERRNPTVAAGDPLDFPVQLREAIRELESPLCER